MAESVVACDPIVALATWGAALAVIVRVLSELWDALVRLAATVRSDWATMRAYRQERARD